MNSSVIASLIGSLSLVVSAAAVANEPSDVQLQNMNRNVFYKLTPEIATHLNLDYNRVAQSMRVQIGQDILFKINEKDEMDLSIFENKVFAEARADAQTGN